MTELNQHLTRKLRFYMKHSVDFFMTPSEVLDFLCITVSKNNNPNSSDTKKKLIRDRAMHIAERFGIPVYEWIDGNPVFRYTDVWLFCMNHEVLPYGRRCKHRNQWMRYLGEMENESMKKQKKCQLNSRDTEKSLFLKAFLSEQESS